MKKRMSRFLSGILSAATLSTMISMNHPVQAARLGSTDFMRTFSEAGEHNGELPNNSNVSKNPTEIDVDEFVNEIIYKSIGLIKTHLGERSEAFTKEFTSRIIKEVPTGELSNDQKLDFACKFTHTLLEMIYEKTYAASSFTKKQFQFFDSKALFMSHIIKDISTRPGISDYVKEKCVRDILDTLKGMSDLSEEIDFYYLYNLQKTVKKLDPSEMKDAIAFFSKTREMFYTERKNNCGIDKNIEKSDNRTLGITRNGVAGELLAACKKDYNPWAISKSPIEIDEDVLRSVIISKSLKLIETHLGRQSEDFIKELISRTTKAMPVDGYSPDQKLDFVNTFNDTLEEMILENKLGLSEGVIRQFKLFSANVHYVLIALKNIPKRSYMSYIAKTIYVKEICQVLHNLGTERMDADFNLIIHLAGAVWGGYGSKDRLEDKVREFENFIGN